ncbi:MAG: hypothetical protein LLG14_17650 [Nocardiaceae bacterium]|nr:hypothetical protein [Nocardiaceae bacterium]
MRQTKGMKLRRAFYGETLSGRGLVAKAAIIALFVLVELAAVIVPIIAIYAAGAAGVLGAVFNKSPLGGLTVVIVAFLTLYGCSLQIAFWAIRHTIHRSDARRPADAEITPLKKLLVGRTRKEKLQILTVLFGIFGAGLAIAIALVYVVFMGATSTYQDHASSLDSLFGKFGVILFPLLLVLPVFIFTFIWKYSTWVVVKVLRAVTKIDRRRTPARSQIGVIGNAPVRTEGKS